MAIQGEMKYQMKSKPPTRIHDPDIVESQTVVHSNSGGEIGIETMTGLAVAISKT